MTVPSAGDTAALHTAIAEARLKSVFDSQRSGLTLSVALAATTVAVLWRAIDHSTLLCWLGAFVAVVAARAWLYFRYTQDSRTATTATWQRRFVIGSLTGGLAWGSICIVAFPQDPSLQAFLAFVLAGNAAGAVTNLSAERTAALTYVGASIVPMGWQLFATGSSTAVAMGLMVILFVAVLVSSVQRTHRQIGDMVTARFEADTNLRDFEQARRKVEDLNQRIALATQAARIAVIEHDRLTGRIDWDAQMYALMGIDPTSGPPTYEQWRSRIHPQDLGRTEALLQQVQSGSSELELSYRIIWPDGSVRDIRTVGIFQRDAQGAAVRSVGLCWDVTEWRQLERMKSEFVSIVSHELRTPLTSIRAAVGLLASGAIATQPAKQAELMQLALRNAERLSILIDDLLDMDKIETGKMRFEMQYQALLPVIEQAIAANATYASRQNVELHLTPPAANFSPHARFDTNRLLQVMANLLSNAAKFSPAGSCVDVSIEAHERVVRVCVMDRGPGIQPEYASRLFGKFSQIDTSDTRATGGSGLGLAISRAIVEQMDGSIGFHSVPGTGATFYVELPLRDAADTTVEPQTSRIELPVHIT